MFLVFNSDLVRLISSAQQINPRYLPPPRRSIFCSFLILSGEIKSSNLVFQLRKRENKSSKQQFIERYQDTEMNIYSNKRKIVCVCEFARSREIPFIPAHILADIASSSSCLPHFYIVQHRSLSPHLRRQ